MPLKTYRISQKAALIAVTGALAVGGLAGGCAATATTESTGQSVDGTVITTKVKSALPADEAV